MLGESVVAVALETADSEWRVDSAGTAVFGFAAVVAVWWLYFDRLEDVVLRGASPTPVVYSYAHLPLLMGLAAMSAGVTLAIERAGEEELGTGASVALLGGVALYLVSLVATRWVTVAGPHAVGIALKLATAAILLSLLLVQPVLPPVALAAMLAAVLATLVVVERTLFS